MNQRYRYAAAAVAVLTLGILLTGVIPGFFHDQSNGSSGHGHVKIYPGEITTHPNGTVEFEALEVTLVTYYDAPERYDDVMLCFYDETGAILTDRNVGPMEPPAGDVTETGIRLTEQPRYVVADHPDLRSPAPEFDQEILIWNEDAGRYDPGHPDELPFDFPRSSEPGTCP